MFYIDFCNNNIKSDEKIFSWWLLEFSKWDFQGVCFLKKIQEYSGTPEFDTVRVFIVIKGYMDTSNNYRSGTYCWL